MTPRQRWIATFEGRQTDRVTTDYWGTAEATAKLNTATGLQDDAMWRHLDVDLIKHVGARKFREGHPLIAHADQWGVVFRKMEYGTGDYNEVDVSPLAGAESVRDVENFAWPKVEDHDFSPVAEAVAKDDGYRFIRGGAYEPFLIYCAMRGMEQAFSDMVEKPEIAEAALAKLFDFHYEYNRRVFEAGAGKIQMFYLAEDLGGQHGPLFSLEMYRRFLRPGQQKMAALAHQYGAKVFYHTDGAARVFLKDLIEVVQIDLLNPLQWRCSGMELPELVRDFAAHVVFHGGIDNQQTLPFGTEAAVREEVRWVGSIMRQNKARWVCAPCHNIQSVSSVANVLALYDEAHQLEPWDSCRS